MIKKYKLPIFIVTTILLALYITLPTFLNIAKSNPEIDETIVIEKNNQEYQVNYGVGIDNESREAVARIEYSRDSIEGVEKYVLFNQNELNTIQKTHNSNDVIAVEITFSSPLNQSQFTKFVKSYNLNVSHYTMYSVKNNGNLEAGDLTTIQGKPSKEHLIPPTDLKLTLQGVSEDAKDDTRFVGWVTVTGLISVENAAQAMSNKQVYLVDVTDTIVIKMLNKSSLRSAGVPHEIRNTVLDEGLSDIYRPPLAYTLVELQIMSLEKNTK